jgi:hypothetical protein
MGLSFTDYMHVTPDGQTHGSCFNYWNCDWVQAPDLNYVELAEPESRLLGANLVGTSTAMARRTVLEQVSGFDVASRFAEDWDLWLRMAAVAGVGYSRAVTMSYLVRPNSETANRDGRIAAMRAVVARYQDRPEPAMIQAVRAARSRIDVAVAEAARARGDHVAAANSHFKAFAATPEWRTGKAVAADIVAAGRRVFSRRDERPDSADPDSKS